MGIFDFFKRRKVSKTPSPVDQPPEADRIGQVQGFYRKISVAVIQIEKGTLEKNQKIWIKGHTTDLKLIVDSVEIDHKPVERAEKGQSVGLKVKKRVRRGDKIYLVK